MMRVKWYYEAIAPTIYSNQSNQWWCQWRGV